MEIENNNSEIKIKKKDSIWDLIKFALIAFAVVLPIRMFIAQPFVVSGDSMNPTFDDGQYLIVDEISYIMGKPNRGDVVIFRYPKDTKRFFIKRIIGLPNEEIIIEGKTITIINENNPNGLILTEPYIKEDFDYSGSYKTDDQEYFVLGDNRNRSSDSRFWGILPEKLVIGRAYLRLLPIKNISHLPGAFEQDQ